MELEKPKLRASGRGKDDTSENAKRMFAARAWIDQNEEEAGTRKRDTETGAGDEAGNGAAAQIEGGPIISGRSEQATSRWASPLT